MKVLLITLALFVAGAFARSTVEQTVMAEGPECPIEDPLERAGPLAINITLDPLLALAVGSQITDLKVEGLSTLHYDVAINAILLSARFEVTIQRVSGNGTYQANGYVDARPLAHETVPSGNFTGSGLGKLSATNVHLKGSASIILNLQGRVQLSRLVLETVSFDTLEVDLGAEFRSGGEPVDWDDWSRNSKSRFDADFGRNKDAVTDKIRLSANNVLKQFTLQELIDLIDGGGDGGGDGCDTTPAP